MYIGKGKTTIDDCYRMWLAFGIGDELAKKVKEKTEKLMKDHSLAEKIEGFYDKMLLLYSDEYMASFGVG